jgi:hypothetical protein
MPVGEVGDHAAVQTAGPDALQRWRPATLGVNPLGSPRRGPLRPASACSHPPRSLSGLGQPTNNNAPDVDQANRSEEDPQWRSGAWGRMAGPRTSPVLVFTGSACSTRLNKEWLSIGGIIYYQYS